MRIPQEVGEWEPEGKLSTYWCPWIISRAGTPPAIKSRGPESWPFPIATIMARAHLLCLRSAASPGHMSVSAAKTLEKSSQPGSPGQILPSTCFCSALKLRTFSSDEWFDDREHYLWTPMKQNVIPSQKNAFFFPLRSNTVLPKNCTQFNF